MNIGIVSCCNPKNIIGISNIENLKAIFTQAPSVETYINGLLRNGHYVRIFTTHNKGDNVIHIKNNGFDFYSIKRSCSANILSPIFETYMTGKKLGLFMKDKIEELDVLHSQWTYEYAYACIPYAKKTPVFCTIRDWLPYIRATLPLISKTNILWYSKKKIWEKVIRNKNIHFISNSEYTQIKFHELFPNKECPIIYNPIDKERILKEKKCSSINPTFISISVSLNKRKNYKPLILAFNKYLKSSPNAKLILCGGPFNLKNPVIQQWKTDGLLNNVELKGKIERNELFKLIDNSSLLIHPSLEETFGNTLIEAMARRVPCIGGRDSGAVPYVLQHGKAGCLCDVSDYNSITSAIELLMNDHVYYDRIINNATQLLINKYLDDVIVNKHLTYYKSMKIEQNEI